MEIEVIRSKKRKKTVQAALRNGKMVVYIPHRMTKTEEKEIVENFKKKFENRNKIDHLNAVKKLLNRAQTLNQKYFQGKLKMESVEFVDNQNQRFGSCNYRTGNIRISNRLAKAPRWVLDYILMHEMAHMVHPDHSKAFWECVYQFPLTERAKGYLIALSLMHLT